MFVQSLIDNGVASEVITASLPTHVAASLVGGGVSVESYNNDLYASTCISTILEYDGFTVAYEAFCDLVDASLSQTVSQEGLLSSAEALKDRAADAVEKLKEKLTRLKAYAVEQSKKGSQYAKEHPYKTAGGILAAIAIASAAVLLGKFIMTRRTDIKTVADDLAKARSEFEASFAEKAKEMAAHGVTPEEAGMKIGTKGTTSKFVRDTFKRTSDGTVINVSDVARKRAVLSDEIKNIISKHATGTADSMKLDPAYEQKYIEKIFDLMRLRGDSFIYPGDVVFKRLHDLSECRVSWDYVTLGKKIDEAVASLDKLKSVLGSAKEFTLGMAKSLNPMDRSNVSWSGKAMWVWQISIYGLVTTAIAKLVTMAAGKISTPIDSSKTE